MKKTILLTIGTILLAMLFSAFTFSSNEVSITKANKHDSTNINVQVNAQATPKIDNNLYKEYLQSGIDANKSIISTNEIDKIAKQYYIVESNQENEQALKDTFTVSNYRLREIMKCTGKSKKILFREARGDLTSKFISYLLIFLLFGWLISNISSDHNRIDWRYQLIKFSIIMIGILLLNYQLYFIISYIFNHGYLFTQEIIKLI